MPRRTTHSPRVEHSMPEVQLAAAKWLQVHSGTLRKHHWVAANNRQAIAMDRSYEGLIEKLAQKRVDFNVIAIQYILGKEDAR